MTLVLELVQCLAQGRPADADPAGELPLSRQAASRRKRPAPQQVAELAVGILDRAAAPDLAHWHGWTIPVRLMLNQ